MKKVAIIGGGITGLAAAYTLQRHGRGSVQVTLIESGPRLGGKIASDSDRRLPRRRRPRLLHQPETRRPRPLPRTRPRRPAHRLQPRARAQDHLRRQRRPPPPHARGHDAHGPHHDAALPALAPLLLARQAAHGHGVLHPAAAPTPRPTSPSPASSPAASAPRPSRKSPPRSWPASTPPIPRISACKAPSPCSSRWNAGTAACSAACSSARRLRAPHPRPAPSRSPCS